MNSAVPNSACIILAGGQSSRMHYQDKALLSLGEERVIDLILATLSPQVNHVAINANRNIDVYQQLGVPVLPDSHGSDAGPIAGIHAGMHWACEQLSGIDTVFCCPGDVPWFPDNTVALLSAAMQTHNVAVTYLSTDGQWQPLFSLWSTSLLSTIEDSLKQGLYSPMALIHSLPNAVVRLDNNAQGQFANLNTPQDLQFAQKLLASQNRD